MTRNEGCQREVRCGAVRQKHRLDQVEITETQRTGNQDANKRIGTDAPGWISPTETPNSPKVRPFVRC